MYNDGMTKYAFTILLALAIGFAGGFFVRPEFQSRFLDRNTKKSSEILAQERVTSTSNSQVEVVQSRNDRFQTNSRYLKLVSPSGVFSWCIGKSYPIIWESKGIDVVNAFVVNGGVEYRTYRVGSFPPDYNNANTAEADQGSALWEIPTSVQPGLTYKILLTGNNAVNSLATPQLEFESPKLFSITRCDIE